MIAARRLVIKPRHLQRVIIVFAIYVAVGGLYFFRLFAGLPSPDGFFRPPIGHRLHRPLQTRPYKRLLSLYGEEDGLLDAQISDHERQPGRDRDNVMEVAKSRKEKGELEDTSDANKETKDCKPMSLWQTASFPTCNIVYEMDMVSRDYNDETTAEVLALGGKRIAWKFRHRCNSTQRRNDAETVIIKTLQWSKNYTGGAYETNRRDAVAMERLTSSPRVISVYGFCGVVVVNEFGYLGGADTYFGEDSDVSLTRTDRLRFARDAALAISDVHAIHGESLGGNATALVHGDVRTWNFVVTYAPGKRMSGGSMTTTDNLVLKLHDFNAAKFIEWNTTGRSICRFQNNVCNMYRSPDECRGIPQDEKIDVYGLGHIIFFFLTGSYPLKGTRLTSEEREEFIRSGQNTIAASLSDTYAFSKDPAIVAMRFAMIVCERFDPSKRGSAALIARVLANSYEVATNATKLKEYYELRNNVSASA